MGLVGVPPVDKVDYLLAVRHRAREQGDRALERALTADLARLGHHDPPRVPEPPPPAEPGTTEPAPTPVPPAAAPKASRAPRRARRAAKPKDA